MADDKFSDPSDEPAELSDDAEIVDPEDSADDAYVDDPDTPDINEAKLDRATDRVAEEGPEPDAQPEGDDQPEDSAAPAPRRSRPTRPVRRGETRDGDEDADQSSLRTEKKSDATAKTKKASTRKDRATRKRREAEQERAAKQDRTTPAAFVRESTTELRKVVWPTGTQVQQYFVVVLVFVLFIIAFVSLLDLGFGWLVLKAFG